MCVGAEWIQEFELKLRKKAPAIVVKRLMDSMMNPWEHGLVGGRRVLDATKWKPYPQALEGKDMCIVNIIDTVMAQISVYVLKLQNYVIPI